MPLSINLPRSISIEGLEKLPSELAEKLQKFIDAVKYNPRQLDIWVEGKDAKTLGTVTLGRDLKSPFIWFDNVQCNIKDLLDNFDQAMEDLEGAFLLSHERETLEKKRNKPFSKKYNIFKRVPD